MREGYTDMDIEFIKNEKTGILEAWSEGRAVGEFIPAEMMVKHRSEKGVLRKNREPDMAT